MHNCTSLYLHKTGWVVKVDSDRGASSCGVSDGEPEYPVKLNTSVVVAGYNIGAGNMMSSSTMGEANREGGKGRFSNILVEATWALDSDILVWIVCSEGTITYDCISNQFFHLQVLVQGERCLPIGQGGVWGNIWSEDITSVGEAGGHVHELEVQLARDGGRSLTLDCGLYWPAGCSLVRQYAGGQGVGWWDDDQGGGENPWYITKTRYHVSL